jgi:LuxR family maltose regulon positive regulatory protein
VLERQDMQLRTFLRETSVLERLSGALCDAVTGREGSQALLEEAERAGLFLIPLDEVRGWWRYHHLFAGLLRARLREKQPGRAAQLHCNAAAWYAAHELADDAIGHAAAAGEMLWAARVIEQHVDLVFNFRGEAATIRVSGEPMPAADFGSAARAVTSCRAACRMLASPANVLPGARAWISTTSAAEP